MPQLFKTSMQKWKEVADTMGATYILWNASMLESLVRQEYPELWDMYCDVRYPIMRCDIGRICIIHSYGGLYSDFDVFPNRIQYQQEHLSVTRVKLPPTKAMKRKASRLGRQPRVRIVLDMEVIIGCAGHAFFVRWLEHIRCELDKRDYSNPASPWFDRKMRYIWQTTGPYCMRRFAKLDSNTATMETARYLECNYFKNAPSASQALSLDVISHVSNSYYTDQHEIRVPVGEGNTTLPTRPKSVRMRRKCNLRRTVGDGVVTSQGVHSGGGAAVVMMEAPRDRDGDATPNGQAGDASDRGQGGDAAVRGQDNVWVEASSTECRQVALEYVEDKHHTHELRSYFYKARLESSTKTCMEGMSVELRDWLMKEWPVHHGGDGRE